MRCRACNVALNDFEATRKSKENNEFVDLCNNCYSNVSNEINALERYDLMHCDDIVSEDLTDSSDAL